MLMRFRSKAFREGLLAGLTAPYSVFVSPPKPTYRRKDLVAASWQDVGNTWRVVMQEAGAIADDKAPRKVGKARRDDHHAT